MSTVNIQETSTVASEDEGNSTASCRVCTEEEQDSPRWKRHLYITIDIDQSGSSLTTFRKENGKFRAAPSLMVRRSRTKKHQRRTSADSARMRNGAFQGRPHSHLVFS